MNSKDPLRVAQHGLGFLLNDTARLLRRNFNRRVQELGLTEAQWRVLANISRCPGIRQAQLADILDMQPISVARQIDRMESAGWVQRCKDPDDRRAVNLQLTDKVEPIIKKMLEQGELVHQQAVAGLSEQEQSLLLEHLLLISSH
jgi:DNA-binding MarR family transcriptional regulator